VHRPATALVGALAAGRDFCITVAMDVEARLIEAVVPSRESGSLEVGLTKTSSP
jgi:hypothetical protein